MGLPGCCHCVMLLRFVVVVVVVVAALATARATTIAATDSPAHLLLALFLTTSLPVFFPHYLTALLSRPFLLSQTPALPLSAFPALLLSFLLPLH